MFGIVEIIRNLEQSTLPRAQFSAQLKTLAEQAGFRGLLAGGAARHRLGSLLGILPGGGAVLAALRATRSRRRSPRTRAGSTARSRAWPDRNPPTTRRRKLLHPLLTLGLPSNAIMALMMGAMIIQGIQPGSAVMTKRPDLFWGMVASMWIGN